MTSIESKRDIQNIIYKFIYIINNWCDDTASKDKWLLALDWFTEFDIITSNSTINDYSKYYPNFHNIANEYDIIVKDNDIDQIKWVKLTEIVNSNISEEHLTIKWEKKIIDILIDIDDGADIPNIYDNNEINLFSIQATQEDEKEYIDRICSYIKTREDEEDRMESRFLASIDKGSDRNDSRY